MTDEPLHSTETPPIARFPFAIRDLLRHMGLGTLLVPPLAAIATLVTTLLFFVAVQIVVFSLILFLVLIILLFAMLIAGPSAIIIYKSYKAFDQSIPRTKRKRSCHV